MGVSESILCSDCDKKFIFAMLYYRKAKSLQKLILKSTEREITGYPSSIAVKPWEKDTLVSTAKPNSLSSKGLN